jgi:hypothetical protein
MVQMLILMMPMVVQPVVHPFFDQVWSARQWLNPVQGCHLPVQAVRHQCCHAKKAMQIVLEFQGQLRSDH